MASDLSYDLHYLMALDARPAPASAASADPDEGALLALAAENIAALCTEVIRLPRTGGEDGVLATLPPPVMLLPREKHVPVAAEPTKWEAFAREKGIQRRKRGAMVYDEKAQEYRPRWGYRRRTDNTIEHDAIADTKPGVTDFAGAPDPFELARRERKGRVEKNRAQNAANAERASSRGGRRGRDQGHDHDHGRGRPRGGESRKVKR